jgi:hypothetical protein
VLQEGEAYDSPRVKAQVGPVATMVLHDAMEAQNYGSVLGEFAGSGAPDPGLELIFREYHALYESYTPTDARYLTLHKGHLMFVRPEEGRFVTADLIRTLTRSGSLPPRGGIVKELMFCALCAEPTPTPRRTKPFLSLWLNDLLQVSSSSAQLIPWVTVRISRRCSVSRMSRHHETICSVRKVTVSL